MWVSSRPGDPSSPPNPNPFLPMSSPSQPLHLEPGFFKDLEAVTLLLECDPKPVWLRAAAAELETMAAFLRTVADNREKAADTANREEQA